MFDHGTAGRRRLGRTVWTAGWCLVLVAVLGGCGDVQRVSPASGGTTSQAAPPANSTAHPRLPRSGTARPAPSCGPWKSRLAALLDHTLAGQHASVAIRDLTTGTSFDYRDDRRFVTASIAKVEILVTLLMRARKEGRELTGDERELAMNMIEHSDNKAADALWPVAGGGPAMAATDDALGLTHTEQNYATWGLIRTSATDQVRLLRALSGDTSVVSTSRLSMSDRRYVLGLMRHVESDQAWGVSAATESGEAPGGDSHPDVAIKNGWLPYSGEGGQWVVNSIGRVRVAGHDLLIAALSDEHATMGDGEATVERAAKTAANGLLDACPSS